jgi:hypothetical protein
MPFASAGVVIDSAPTEGVRVQPVSQARSLFPALSHPSTRHRAVGLTPEEFHYAFTNTLSEEDSKAVWDRHCWEAVADYALTWAQDNTQAYETPEK